VLQSSENGRPRAIKRCQWRPLIYGVQRLQLEKAPTR
jgi:hypothetical protein